jgi:hypothetical protein
VEELVNRGQGQPRSEKTKQQTHQDAQFITVKSPHSQLITPQNQRIKRTIKTFPLI